MFKKVLIANRGEIACRIIRTLRRMGICSIAVYSEVDENALHVEMADEAYLIGPAPARQSYLNIPAIIDAAQRSKAEAIHPGYGFLSENAHFAREVQKNGLAFIGPSPEAIEWMGDKIESKRLAKQAGVRCLPGGDEAISNLTKVPEMARVIGYPVMVKAAAGGGGKGLRIVNNERDLEPALKSTAREAESSFGDGRIFLEKYIPSARHIEIQILADTHGNTIHLGERECSLQRRHQKVIEEAPSLFVTPELRNQMTHEAIRLAQAITYTSVGTVEFVVDEKRDFYFLEMNTRLQVEHPVTEMITGLDLVEEMIRVAAGEPLSVTQKDIHFQGHAIETRIYAEDSSRGFLPSTGHVRAYHPPPFGRLESGIREGDEVTPYYDPLIAKFIVYELKRDLACKKLLKALDSFYIRGISTNIDFLAHLVNAPFFRAYDFNTTTLDQKYGEGFVSEPLTDVHIPVGVAAVMQCIRHRLSDQSISVCIERKAYSALVSYNGRQYEVKDKEKILVIETNWQPGEGLFKAIINGLEITLQVDARGIEDELSWNGYKVTTRVMPEKTAELYKYMPSPTNADSSKHILAPMPGRVIEVSVSKGDHLKASQAIATIEAMKMENIIRSKCAGEVNKVYVKVGDSVTRDQVLVEMT